MTTASLVFIRLSAPLSVHRPRRGLIESTSRIEDELSGSKEPANRRLKRALLRLQPWM